MILFNALQGTPGAVYPMGAMMNWYIQHTALLGNAAADSRQPGAIAPIGRYHDGTVKDVLVHTIW